MIGLGPVYGFAGLMLTGIAISSGRDRANPRRIRNAAFWALLAVSFLAGDQIGDFANGLLVLALVALGGLGLGRGAPPTTTPAERAASAARRGDFLFLPALIVPLVTIIGTFVIKRIMIHGAPVADPRHATLLALALGVFAALISAMAWLRPPILAPLHEARRLADSVGWAVMLPQLLAALGAVFAAVGMGNEVGGLIARHAPLEGRLAAVAAYTVGMAAFTIVMGNGFAAFPVMTVAIGIPLIIRRDGGDPAVVAALGMLSGFCGALLTPMAANFNVVPAVLLDLPDRNAVIRAQAPTAILLLMVNTMLMYRLAFP